MICLTLPFTRYFYRYAKEYKVYIFDRKDHIEEGISIENIADDLYHSLQELHIAKALS